MYSMTDSQVIHQADQREEFEQNPLYFNRNQNPNNIHHNIGNISRNVNSFISKLLKVNKSQIKDKQSCLNKSQNRRVNEPNSQINQLASNTQRLIQDLSWINSIKSTNAESIILKKRQNQTICTSETSYRNEIQQKTKSINPRKTQNQLRSDRNPIKFANKTMGVIDFDQLERSRHTNSISIKNMLPKTVQIYQKILTMQRSNQNNLNNKVNRIFFDRKQNKQFDQFDDKDIVVNQSDRSKRRSYTMEKTKDQKKKSHKQKDEINIKRITKKTLFQKMLKLQEQIKELKNVNKKQTKIKYTSNKRQDHLRPNIYSKLQNQIMNLSNQREQSLNKKIKLSMNPFQPQLNESINPSVNLQSDLNRKVKRSSKIEDRKINLNTWVSQVW